MIQTKNNNINILKKNFLWNTFGNIVYLGCQWLMTILVTRQYGFEDAGVLSLAMSISAAFQTIALFGIRNYQVSDINCIYNDKTYVMLRNITCIITLTSCTAFTLINDYSTFQIIAIFWFMLFRLAENYSDVIYGIAQKNGRLDIAGKGFAIKGILMLNVYMLGYFLNCKLNTCILLIATSSWISTLTFDLILTERIHNFELVDHLKSCFQLAKETLPLCIYSFLNASISVIPKYFLEKMTDNTTFGAYSSVFAPALLIQAAAMYIYTPFVTKFAELYQNRHIKDFYLLAAKIFMVIVSLGLLVFICATVAGKWGLVLLFGESIIPYSELLFLIIIGTFCTALNAFVQTLAVVIREFKGLLISCMIGFIVTIVVSYVMIKVMSADGASVGLITGNMSGAMILILFLVRKLRIFNGLKA